MTDDGELSLNIHATGDALDTVQRHNGSDEDITLFAGCFCPFVQRAWLTLEYLGIPYKYYEVDPYQKPQELLDLSPKGLVPALKLNNYTPPRRLSESSVIMEYLQDIAPTLTQRSLLPPPSDPYARALVRLQADHVNRILIPAFYRYLQAQDLDAQIASGTEFRAAIDTLIGLFEHAEDQVGGTGLWKDGGELGWADVMVAPWMFSATIMLKHYRGFEMPQGEKFNAWLKRLFEHPAFKSTCCTEQLYLDSYERQAQHEVKKSRT